MIVMLSVTGTILKARQLGVWYRLLGTPVSKAQILGGIYPFLLFNWTDSIWHFNDTNACIVRLQWGNLLG